MSFRSVLWFLLFAALLFAVVVILIFRTKRENSVLESVPANATGVFYMPDASFFSKRLKETSWWSSMEKSDYLGTLSADLALLDTLLHLSGLSQHSGNFDAAVVLLEAAGTQHFVFYAQVGRAFPYWDLHEKALPVFGNRFELLKRKTAGRNGFLLLDRQKRRQLNYAFLNGLAIVSFSREAFETAVGAMDSPQSMEFKTVASQMGPSSRDAMLFAQPARLSDQLSSLFLPPWSTSISNTTKQLDKWIAVDLHIRDNVLLINGLLYGGSLFAEVDEQGRLPSDSLIRWLPVGTMAFRASYVAAPEAGFMISGRAANSGSGMPFLILVPDAPEGILQTVFASKPRVASPWNPQWSAPVDATGLIAGLSASPFLSSGQKTFVTTDGRLFLFSSDLLFLRSYIESQQQHLSDIDITRLLDVLSSRSGLLLYHQISKAAGRLSEVSESRLKYRLARDAAAMHGIESVSLQLSKSAGKIYLSLLVRGNSNPMGQAIPVWSKPLDANGAFAPFIFTDESRVVAFDSSGWMYGFSSEGRMLWKKQIGGLPISTPVVVNHPGLKRRHFIFNTTDKVFLTDASGNHVPGFPLQLPSRATSGLTFSNNLIPAFYVNSADRRTYAFNLAGKPLAGWIPPLLPDISMVSPMVFNAGEMTYVLVSTIESTLKIFDESGFERIRLREPLNKAEGAGIHLNRTNSRGLFLTSGIQGEQVYIGSSGISRTSGPERFSQNHYFLYDDFDADQSPDFMYADGSRVVVYDRFNRLILEGLLPREIDQKPIIAAATGIPGVWCFDMARSGIAAVASMQHGLLTYPDLPKGGNYGFGRAEASGPLLLGAYEKNKLILFRLN